MVDDRDMVARLQKPQILDLLGTVGVDNNQKRLAVGYHDSLSCAYERLLIFGAFAQKLYKRLCRAFFRIRNNERTLAVFAGEAAHADGAADTVHIAELVPHNEDARRILYERFQRICHDA